MEHLSRALHGPRTARLSERSLAVLNALLTFHPETVLTGDDLIVFPSNEQIALRAHGMPSSTMRRHLALLVDAGLIIRRDSPNGKRYARKGSGGAVSQAFGFDLSPLVARAAEIEGLAEAVMAEERELRYARERITLARRDIVKMIATGLEEAIPLPSSRAGALDLGGRASFFRAVVSRITPNASIAELEQIADELGALADDLLKALESHVKQTNMGANGASNEHHIQNSNPKPPIDLEPALQESRTAQPASAHARTEAAGRNRVPPTHGARGLPGHCRLRQGRDLALARTPRRGGRRAHGPRRQPERVGGGAGGHGRKIRRDRHRGHPPARRGDHQRRRLSARAHAQSAGQRILDRADADGPDRRQETERRNVLERKETEERCFRRNIGDPPDSGSRILLAGSNRSGALSRALETRCLGQVHREAVAPTLAAGHFRRSVAASPLDVAFVDLGRRGEAGAQRVSGRLLLPLACGMIAAHAAASARRLTRRATWRS